MVLEETLICEVCIKNDTRLVVASPWGAFSHAICKDCLEQGAVETWLVEGNLLLEGGWDKLSPEFQEVLIYKDNTYVKAKDRIPNPSPNEIDRFWNGRPKREEYLDD